MPILPAALGRQCRGLALSDPTRSQRSAFRNVTSISSWKQNTSYEGSTHYSWIINEGWCFCEVQIAGVLHIVRIPILFSWCAVPGAARGPRRCSVLPRLLQHCITAITYPLHILFQTSGNVFTKTIWNLGLKPKLAVKANRVASKRTYFYFVQTSMLFLDYNKGKYSSYQSSVYLTSFLWQSWRNKPRPCKLVLLQVFPLAPALLLVWLRATHMFTGQESQDGMMIYFLGCYLFCKVLKAFAVLRARLSLSASALRACPITYQTRSTSRL